MSALTIIFITVIICAELDFFAVLYCKEISEWLNAKSEEIRAKAESLRKTNPAYNAGYNTGYMNGKIDGMKASAYGNYANISDEPDTEIFRKEGSD